MQHPKSSNSSSAPERSPSIGRLISRIHRASHVYFNRELDQFDLGIGQLHFLMLLYRGDGRTDTQECLARRLMTDKSTSTRAMKKLESEGYITRRRSADDKRAYHIELTDRAREEEPEIKAVLKEWSGSLLTGFSDDERKQVFSFLERIADNAASSNTSCSTCSRHFVPRACAAHRTNEAGGDKNCCEGA